jgi:hypothetical protein
MEEQIVKLETAKLAKEKGFNVKCENFYNRGSGYRLQNDSIIRTGADVIYEAPTQSLLQKWLREKYNIHVEITWVDTLSNIYVYHISTTGNAIRPDSQFYNSYEEALENGLLEGLNLI